MEPDIYTLPASFYVVCVMSSMAFVFCSIKWLLNAYREGATIQSFSNAIWVGQIHIFFFVIIISISTAFYDYFAADQSIDIIGEVVILVGVYSLLFKGDKKNFPKIATSFTGRYVTLGISCLLGWCVTMAFGSLIYMVCSYLTAMNSADFMVVVVFLTGLMWAVVVALLYFKILKEEDKRPVLQGKNVAAFLWPVLLAYFILLVPLVIQSTANSQEWQEAMRAKPMKKI